MLWLLHCSLPYYLYFFVTHLYVCLTYSSVHTLTLHPLLADHHLCYNSSFYYTGIFLFYVFLCFYCSVFVFFMTAIELIVFFFWACLCFVLPFWFFLWLTSLCLYFRKIFDHFTILCLEITYLPCCCKARYYKLKFSYLSNHNFTL